MDDLLSCLRIRGGIPFSADGYRTSDALAFACLSYLDLDGVSTARGMTLAEVARVPEWLHEGTTASFAIRKELFLLMAASERYSECRIHHALCLADEKIRMQFAAMCVDLPDGTTVVAFRGTDNTLLGWREDFDMAYLPVVPGQQAAACYLERVAELGCPLRVTGHSKGGNLAMYAAAMAPTAGESVLQVHSFDGPGLSDEVFRSEGFSRILPKLWTCCPQTGIIGRLMNVPDNMRIVHSSAGGIRQHDPFSWEFRGPEPVLLTKTDATSDLICETLHEWLDHSTDEQRGEFVETLFQLIGTTDATHLSDLGTDRLKKLMTVIGAAGDVDPEMRRVFTRLLAQFVTLGAGNVWERVMETPLVSGAGSLWNWVKDAAKNVGPENLMEKVRDLPSGAGSLFDRVRDILDDMREAPAGETDGTEEADAEADDDLDDDLAEDGLE